VLQPQTTVTEYFCALLNNSQQESTRANKLSHFSMLIRGVSIMIRWRAGGPRIRGSILITGKIFSSNFNMWPTQTLIQWVPTTLIPVLKPQGRKDDQSPPSIAKAENEWLYTSKPSIRLRGVGQANVTFRR